MAPLLLSCWSVPFMSLPKDCRHCSCCWDAVRRCYGKKKTCSCRRIQLKLLGIVDQKQQKWSVLSGASRLA